MATFDQRGQKVTYQYNAAGNIKFSSVTNETELSVELQKLLDEVTRAVRSGAVDAEIGADVEAKVKKTVIQSQKSDPNKQTILDNINGAKALIEGVTSAAGLVNGFVQAIETIRRVL